MSEQLDEASIAASPPIAERQLVAAVLMRAHDDCATGDPHEAGDAYLWVVDDDPVMRSYCHILGLDPGQFRERFIKLHAQRCETILRRIALRTIKVEQNRAKRRQRAAAH